MTPSVRRLRLLLMGLVAWTVLIIGRLVWLQVYKHDDLVAQAAKQQQKSMRTAAMRGAIYDRTGKPLAQTLEADSVVANPQKIANLAEAAVDLARALNLNTADLLHRLQAAKDKGERFLYVARKLTPVESDRVHALKMPGIEFEAEMRRYYPRGELAAHLLGSMGHIDRPVKAGAENVKVANTESGLEEDPELGTAGFERLFEKELAGTPGRMKIFRDSKQRVYSSEVTEAPADGTSFTLTIDPNVQYQAEYELREAVKVSGAKGGTVVAMDPYTGDVLAMASYPTYNPNLPQGKGEAARDARSNLAIAANFEPGSVFKVITLAAALENTKLKPTSMINCGNGKINLFGRVIHDHKSYSALSMADVLAHSSNIGAIQIALQTGNKPLYEAQQNFGFGKKTGIELPAEASGKLWPVENWTKSSIGSIAMGHEVTVTSLQLAVAGSVIANGGMHVKPRLVLSKQRAGQPVEKTPASKAERILKPETAIQMRQMMEGVVLNGTGKKAVLSGYTSGGKTGSAQIYDPKTGKYTHIYNASFLGFAPVTNPRIVISVSLFGTTGGETGYGGVRAAPVFREVAMGALRIMDVPKDLAGKAASEATSSAFDEDDLPFTYLDTRTQQLIASGLARTPDDAAPLLSSAKRMDDRDIQRLREPFSSVHKEAAPVHERSVSSVTRPPAPSGTPISDSASSQRPFFKNGGPVVPDFRGMTLRAVLQRSTAEGLDVQVSGSGVAVSQDPPPGSSLQAHTAVRVEFGR